MNAKKENQQKIKQAQTHKTEMKTQKKNKFFRKCCVINQVHTLFLRSINEEQRKIKFRIY
jgi:hypothetical protein